MPTISEIEKDPYVLMPKLRKAHFFTALLDRIENRTDSKAIAGWISMIVAGLFAAAGVLTSLYRFVSSGSLDFLFDIKTPIGLVFVASLSTIFVIFLIMEFKKRRERNLLLAADTGAEFRILQKTTIACVRSREKVDFISRYWVKARKNGVRVFDANFGWTSDDDTVRVRVRNSSHSVRVTNASRAGWKCILIDLGRTLKKGHTEVIDFCYHTDTTGRRLGEPYIATTISSPKLPRFNTFLGVFAAGGVDIVTLYREQYFSFLANDAIRRDVVQLDSERQHLWPAPVKLGWRVRLAWSFGEVDET